MQVRAEAPDLLNWVLAYQMLIVREARAGFPMMYLLPLAMVIVLRVCCDKTRQYACSDMLVSEYRRRH